MTRELGIRHAPETDTTGPAPFTSTYVIELLLHGPSLRYQVPGDARAREELRMGWGVAGEKAALAWERHETFLRSEAVARGIRPRWPGNRFFAEALAASTRRK
jgi:hypothetical protein